MHSFKTRLFQLNNYIQVIVQAVIAPIATWIHSATDVSHKATKRIAIALCFILSLILILSIQLTNAGAVAQSPEALVQAGVNAYGAGSYQNAIEHWENALENYSTEDYPLERAVVLTNLAKAYRQLGQLHTANGILKDTEAIYGAHPDMRPKLGRIKTERAQILTSLGQYERAILLICPIPYDSTTIAKQQITIPNPLSNLGNSADEYQPENCAAGGAYPIAIDESVRDLAGEVAALGSMADAYRLMGDHKRAIVLLKKGLALIEENPDLDQQYKLSLLSSLGNAYGREARVFYQRAKSAEGRNATGSAEKFRENGNNSISEAVVLLNQALELAQQQNNGAVNELRTQLNLLKLYRISLREKDGANLTLTQQRIDQLLEQVPDSREKAYGAIALVSSYQTELAPLSCFKPGTASTARKQLLAARDIAQRIGDERSLALAIGYLGNIYKCQGDNKTALKLTLDAEWKADDRLASPDSLYLWQWQRGRIYEEQGQRRKALDSYLEAIRTLTGIREEDILTTNQNLAVRGFQFDFRDVVEPLYRQALWLQLDLSELSVGSALVKQTAASEPEKTDEQDSECDNPLNLRCALKTFDALRLAELQNYFGNDCSLVPVRSEEVIDLVNIDKKSAVISSIIFQDRLAVLLSTQIDSPNTEQRSNLKLRWINIDRKTLEETVGEYRRNLRRTNDVTLDEVKGFSRQIYGWMIEPFITELEAAGIETLVFVQDGILRSVPMAALWDGEQYLIEKYAIATVPSLNLTAPQSLRSDKLQVLRFGLSERWCDEADAENCFQGLTHVPEELEAIGEILPNSAPALLNENFTAATLEQTLLDSNANVLHLATHGQFSADPESTFIAMGNGEKLTFGQLEQKIRQKSNAEPIELIALTACNTGKGDNRSTLGLAGVAIRAGARSAIASLWAIRDDTTANMMKVFYEELRNPDSNKAQALQKAQVSALAKEKHPGLWSPFILVGNWL